MLPVFLVWHLQLPSRTKFGLSALLSVGLFAGICSMIKISKTADLGKTDDIIWAFTDLSICNVTELNVGVILGSIPPMRPLFRQVYHKPSETIELSRLSSLRTGGAGLSSSKQSQPRRSKYIMQHEDGGESMHHLDDLTYDVGGNKSETFREDRLSEDLILPSTVTTLKGKSGILQTKEIEVQITRVSVAQKVGGHGLHLDKDVQRDI